MPYLKRVKWAEIAAVLLVGLNLMLLGLPGALFVEPVASLLAMAGRKFHADQFWPAAIYVSMLMPVGFLLAIMRAARLRPKASVGALVLWGLLGAVFGGLVFSLLVLGLMTA